jgi:hypothetical protein
VLDVLKSESDRILNCFQVPKLTSPIFLLSF